MPTLQRRVKTGLLLCAVWLLATPAFGHPGATDKNGCHKVSSDYRYIVSGKLLKAGTTHCHAELGKMRIGKDILEDPYDAAEEVKPTKTKGKSK